MTRHCSTPAASASLYLAGFKKASLHAPSRYKYSPEKHENPDLQWNSSSAAAAKVLFSWTLRLSQNVWEMLAGPKYTPDPWEVLWITA